MSRTNRTNTRKINILSEYDYTLGLAQRLYKNSQLSITPQNIKRLQEERNTYWDSLVGVRDTKAFKAEYNKYYKLCKIAIENSAKEMTFRFHNAQSIEVLNFNRQGRANGVTDKTDVQLVVDGEVGRYSLKLYKGGTDIQVASGTYCSTLCGLSFNPVGVGVYETPTGEIFSTMSGKLDSMKEHFGLEYGDRIVELIDEIKHLDNIFKPLVKEVYKGDEFWKGICSEVSSKAIPLMSEAFEIIKEKNPRRFVERLIKRIGFDGKDDIVLVQGKKYFSSINNDATKRMIKRLNDQNVYVNLIPGGKAKNKKGILIELCDSRGCIVSPYMPLTINKNGAWQLSKLSGRYCKLDKEFILYGHPRPKKSKQIATSTNCYIKTKNIFQG